MPRDGSGGYTLTSNAFSTAVTGGTLVAGDANTVWADLVAAIAASLCTDGQSTMTGNLKLGGQKITGQAVGTANTDGTTVGQVQNATMRWGGVVGGTADALTFALSPVITAYVDGQTFFFVASASPNTTAATLDVNSVGAKAIQKAGAALVANDILASKVYAVTYYNNIFHLWSPLPTLATFALLASSNTFTAAQIIALTAAGTALTMQSTDAGAGSGPDLVIDRFSASPAANDILGRLVMRGRDSGGNATDYAVWTPQILDPTNGTEDSRMFLTIFINGSASDVLTIGPGFQVGAPTGGDKGSGTMNLDAALYIDGVAVAGPLYVIQNQQTSGTNGGALTSGSFVKRTLNTEVLDQITVTTSASVVALAAGTYKARWECSFFAVDKFQTRLQDTTNTVTLGIGNNGSAVAGAHAIGTGAAFFTLAGAANLELQSRVQTTNATDGGGQATSFGTEVYTTLTIEKVA